MRAWGWGGGEEEREGEEKGRRAGEKGKGVVLKLSLHLEPSGYTGECSSITPRNCVLKLNAVSLVFNGV